MTVSGCRGAVRLVFAIAAVAGTVPLWPLAARSGAAPTIDEVLRLRCSAVAARLAASSAGVRKRGRPSAASAATPP